MKQKTFWILMGVLLIASLFISNIVDAQDTTKVNISTVYHDVKRGIDVNAPKIEQALGTIAKDLKVTADQVWIILVRQQKVWSICLLIGEILTIFSWTHFWYRMRKGNECKWNEKERHAISAMITFTIASCGTIISAIYFTDMLTGFMNPEYGAMQTIAKVAQSLK